MQVADLDGHSNRICGLRGPENPASSTTIVRGSNRMLHSDSKRNCSSTQEGIPYESLRSATESGSTLIQVVGHPRHHQHYDFSSATRVPREAATNSTLATEYCLANALGCACWNHSTCWLSGKGSSANQNRAADCRPQHVKYRAALVHPLCRYSDDLCTTSSSLKHLTSECATTLAGTRN